MTTIVDRAEAFATQAHASINQVRKYTGEPYIAHPAQVVALLMNATRKPVTQETLAAAWLHDTVEDTRVTLADIESGFGHRIAKLVEEVTDISRPEHGNRAVRKAIDRGHLSLASPEGKTIKLADLISNSNSIIEHDPKFAEIYMVEKRELLKVLKEGDPQLYSMARFIVGKYFTEREAIAA